MVVEDEVQVCWPEIAEEHVISSFFLAGERLKALTNNFTRKDWFVGLSKMTLLPVESASFMKNFRQSPAFITAENEKTKTRWHLYAPDKVWKNLGGVLHGLRNWSIKMQLLLNTENHGIDYYLTKILLSKRGTFGLRCGTTRESFHKHLDNPQTIKECQTGCTKGTAKSAKHYETCFIVVFE